MKKIVFILQHLKTGGAELIVYHLATSLDNQFFEPIIVSFGGGNLESSFEDKGIKVFKIETTNRIARIILLARIIKKLKADIVHTHLTSAGYYGRLASWFMKKMVVHTHHSLIFKDLKTKRLLAEKILLHITNQSVAVSKAVANHLYEYLGRQSKNLLVIPNGIDPAGFRCQRKSFNTPPVIVASGRLEPVKRFDLLFESLSILDVEDWDFHFYLVGDGGQMEALKSQCQSLGLTNKTTFTGHIKNVAPYLKKSDIYVSSSDREGLSIAMLEALATGLPVVATDVGGNPEVLKDIGWLVPSGSVLALATAIRNVLNNQVTAISMGRAGCELVFSKYTIKRMVESYEDLYYNLLRQ